MDTKLRPQEPMVTIPIGMDCRKADPNLEAWLRWHKGASYMIQTDLMKKINEEPDSKEHRSRDADNE